MYELLTQNFQETFASRTYLLTLNIAMKYSAPEDFFVHIIKIVVLKVAWRNKYTSIRIIMPSYYKHIYIFIYIILIYHIQVKSFSEADQPFSPAG